MVHGRILKVSDVTVKEGVASFKVRGLRVLVDEDMIDTVTWRCWKLKRRNDPHIYEATADGKALASIVLGVSNGLVDHINGDPLDNRRQNLRPATPSQNQANRTKYQGRRGVTSRYKGVCWHRKDKKWMARIYRDGKQIYLGGFDCEIEAAKAYDSAALEIFGEFALPNFAPAGRRSAVQEVA